MPRRWLLVALAAASVAMQPQQARAQSNGPDKAGAQFDWGLSEMQSGRYATGCPALAESFRLDPRPGVLFTLAECDNRWGKVATALSLYKEYLDMFARMSEEQKSQQVGRDAIARAQRERLRNLVPMLTIRVGASLPADTTVWRDGEPMAQALLGAPIAVDPGDHVISARTGDGSASEHHVTMAPGDKQTVVLERPESEPAARGGAGGDRSHRTWLIVSASVAAAGLIAGGVSGGLALHDKSTLESNCGADGNPHDCNATGKAAADRAQTEALVSTIAFGVGVAALGAAAFLWLREPHARSTAPAGTVAFRLLVESAGSHGALLGARADW